MLNNKSYKTWVYPGGEVGVRVERPNENARFNIQNSNELLAMLMFIDAHRELEPSNPMDAVIIPYLPYARQDRVATKGDPFAIRVLAKMLSSAGIKIVYSYDVHSRRCIEVFKEHGIDLRSNEPTLLIEDYLDWMGAQYKKVAFIAPDLGARQKTENYCKELGVDRAIQCFKKRDPITGALTGFIIDEDSSATVEGLKRDEVKDLVIVDDICDGGGTFLGVADTIRNHYGNDFRLHLWTTHGIYSKGIDVLLEKFDTLGCSSSFVNPFTHERLHTVTI